jgi:membrane protease YdiL (CAAX protease family)
VTRRVRVVSGGWREVARSSVPLGLLALAAAIPVLRLPILAILVGGTAVAIGRDAPVAWTWAGALPVAASLAWGVLPAPVAAVDGSDCASALSPIALWRVAEAAVVLAVLAELARRLGATRDTLSLRWPADDVVRLSVLGFVVVGPLALILGPILAKPFFGLIEYDVLKPGAIVPALLFAVANGSMEELAYRGALQGWSARVIGVWPAVVGQAIVFGLAHSGPDVAGNSVVLMVTLGLGGFLAGAITVRTRSLLFPLAIHIGLDIPIYYAFACGT